MSDETKEVVEAQTKLGMTMTAINRENLILQEKIKERQAFEVATEEYKEEMLKAKADTKKFKEEKLIAKEELLEAQNETRKEQGLLDDTMKKRVEADEEFNSFKEKSNTEVNKITSDKSQYAREVAKQIEEMGKQIAPLEEQKKGFDC